MKINENQFFPYIFFMARNLFDIIGSCAAI